jgi:hypothetical protein
MIRAVAPARTPIDWQDRAALLLGVKHFRWEREVRDRNLKHCCNCASDVGADGN